MRTLLALFVALLAGAALAQAYRWVDEDGVIHYSDVPHEGAERIQLPEASERRTRSAPSPVSQVAAAADGSQPAPETAFTYEDLEIVAPAPEETLWNIEGVLNVALRVTPALRPQDEVRVYFDGEQRSVTGTSFQLQEVYRGVHNIQAEIVDSTGRLMARSPTNRFYVQQNSIINR